MLNIQPITLLLASKCLMRFRYEKESLCMISMWKVRKIFWRTFQNVTVTNRKTIHTIKHKLTQTRSLSERTKRKCLPKKNWTKMVIGLNTPRENPLNVSHTMQWFKVSRFFYFSKGISIHKCEHFMQIQGIRTSQQGAFLTYAMI